MDVASAFASSMDQMAVMIEGVTEEMRKQLKKARGGGGAGGEQRSFLDPLLGFVHAVDWTEPWLVGLIVFHITLLVLAVASRKHSNVQMAMFFCVLLCVYVAERMNIYLHRHWKSFARQPYFDSHGVFLSVVWSGPLLLVSALILFNSLLTLTSLMVKWKRAELKHRALAFAKKNKEQ
ncbi:unnamed protein product [Sphagnum troendelagicum]|uniref:Transmembrane protein 18 n=1 Tax=Sphagnum troendelagicum TaxID=128251 RepID=A0ABP0TMT2_9BRYO